METIYKAPNWLYKPANIDTNVLPTIQDEVMKLLKIAYPDTDSMTSKFAVPADVFTIKKSCPALMSELDRLGLSDHFLMMALIIVQPGSHYPIHIDSTNPARMSVGLNMPILNCENSYTVWYDAKIQYEKYVPDYVIGSDIAHMSVPVDETTAKEIDRCNANIPHWINVSVPHVPVCDHNLFRVNCSLRFSPKLFEFIADGYFDQVLVKHS